MAEIDIISKLKVLADNIQLAKLGKRGKEVHVNSYTVIDEYHEWRTLSEDLFSNYFDDSNPHYFEFINLPNDGNGHVLMQYFNQQHPIFKVLIAKIESGIPMKSRLKQGNIEVEHNDEATTVFISHASKDKEIVDAFVDVILHGALSVPINRIFCVSTDGTKIKSGEDWRASIASNLLSAKINFLIITPNYKESEVCLNEMGAAWVTSATVLPLILDPVNYKTVGVIQEPKQIEKLLDEQSLDRLKDIVQEKLKISSYLIKSDRWTAKKKEFLARVNKHLKSNTFDIPMDRDAFKELIKQKDDLEKTVINLVEEKSTLEDLVKELKKAKDKKEVEAIVKKMFPSTQFQEFESLCRIVNNLLSGNDGIINGVIFKCYSGKEVSIGWEGNSDELDEALANDYIDRELDVDWVATKEMRDIKSALDKVNKFITSKLKDDFFQLYEEKYDAPLDINNKRFWEEVLDATVNFS